MSGTQKANIRGESAAWIRPLTVNGSGVVTGAGTAILFDFVQDNKPNWPAPEGAAAGEKIESSAANGVTVQFDKVTRRVEGVTGTVTNSSGGNAQKINFTSLEGGKTLLKKLVEWQQAGTLLQACIPSAQVADASLAATEEGFYYGVGTLTMEIAPDAKGEENIPFPVEVTCKSFTADAAGDIALEWVPEGIIPVGEEDEIEPTPLVTADLVTLKSGQIVIK